MTNIDFSVTYPEFDNYAKCKLNENGEIVRTSHSSYVGSSYKKNDGVSLRYTYFKNYKSPKCYVALSKIFEHGVFADDVFNQGDVIEQAKIILLDTTVQTSRDWQLIRHAMVLDCDCDICKNNGKTLFLPTGNLMIYNHSTTPNAIVVVEKSVKKANVIALREIQKDEEITIDYGKNYAEHHLKIKDVYPYANVPEGSVVYLKSDLVSRSECIPCKQQNNVNNLDNQFRSMIVPERILE